jgi:serine/threonine protein kinase
MFALPTHISRYEIKGLIGRGGMGDLFLARDTNRNTNRLVAVKLLNANLDSGDLRERFARESRALSALNHPNIVSIYDSGEFEDSPFIVMEYVRGETLAEKIKRRAVMSTSQKLKLMEELCAGLGHAHEAGIIHRDIKPANLMVDQSGHLKILDFGIARVAEGSFTRAGLEMTMVNVQIGTPGYMAPEQIAGGGIDHRCDLFAVGAVCYELLSYHEAFSGASTRLVEKSVLQAQPAPLAPLVQGLSPDLAAVINRALEKDPAKRYQNAATLEAAFERQRVSLGPSSPPAPVAHPAPNPPPQQSVSTRGARAESAYQRALAIYHDGAHEAARRAALETLAEDPDHEGARALYDRLEPKRRWTPAAPQRPAKSAVASMPTVVKTRVPAAVEESLEPTIVMPALKKAPKSVNTEATMVADSSHVVRIPSSSPLPAPPRPARSQPSYTETSLPLPRPQPRSQPAPSPPARASQPSWLRSAWNQLRAPRPAKAHPPEVRPPAARPAAPRRPARDSGAFWTSYRLAFQIAGIAVAVILVLFGVFRLMGGFGPQRLQLTITKPTGGTISAKGIKCGTLGSDCSITPANGEPVELEVQPDAGFVFAGYTGDCAPAGRTLMLAARTCGATFSKVATPAAAVVQPLTITPPTGGTLLSAGIECGTMGSDCTEDVPDGQPVTLRALADNGYTFLRFTGDCAPAGESLMTKPRNCGATFVQNQAAKNEAAKAPIPAPIQRPVRKPVGGASAPDLPPPPMPTPPAGAQPGAAAGGQPAAPLGPGSYPAPPPISPEDQAKKDIQAALKSYCGAYVAMDPLAIRKVYPSVLAIEEKLRQIKSVECTFTSPPEFQELDPEGGTATVEVGVKQAFDMKVGGTQKQETIATMKLARPQARGAWRIDSMVHRPKPK